MRTMKVERVTRVGAWVLSLTASGGLANIRWIRKLSLLAIAVGFAACHSGVVSAQPQVKVTVCSPIGGTVTPVPGDHWYPVGFGVPISATPDPCYRFKEWTFTGGLAGIIPTVPTLPMLVVGDGTLCPVFEIIPLTVTVCTPANGTVSPSPGDHTYDCGSVVPISATPAPGYSFVSWRTNGDCCVLVADLKAASTTMKVVSGNGSLCAEFAVVMAEVPNVVGMTQVAAQSAITSAGFAVGTVTQAHSSTVPQGNVISQNPTAGTSVAKGSAVNLVISSGPTPPVIQKPTATTQTATAITSTGATLNGTITNDGDDACKYRFRYKKAGGSYSYTTYTNDLRGTGQSFSYTLSGLDPGSTYYFAAQAMNSAGESDWPASDESFTTSCQKPTITTQAATGITSNTATLKGTITNDGGSACQYRFRYKKAGGSYSYTTYTNDLKGTGQSFSRTLSGLDAASQYYFAAQVKNSAGESDWGNEITFTTLDVPVIGDLRGTYFTGTKHTYFLSGVSVPEQVAAKIDWKGLEPGTVEWQTEWQTYVDTCTAGQTEVSHTFDVGKDFGVGGKVRVAAISKGGQMSHLVTANFTVIPQPPLPSGMVLKPVSSPHGGVGVASLVYASGLHLIPVLDWDASLYYGLSIPDSIPMLGGHDISMEVQGIGRVVVMSGVGVLMEKVEVPEAGPVDRLVLNVWGADLNVGLIGNAFFVFDGNSWRVAGSQHFWNYTRVPIRSWGYSWHGIGGKLTLGVESHVDDVLFARAEGNTLAWAGTASVRVPPYAEASADALVASVKAEVKGTGFSFAWTEPIHDLLKFCTDFSVDLTVHTFLYSHSWTVLGPWEYCPYSTSQSSQALHSLSAASAVAQLPLDAGGEGWKLIGRDYLGSDYAVWLPPGPDHEGDRPDVTVLSAATAAQGEGGGEQVLQTNVFEYSEPAVAADKGELLLAWVYDNPARSSANRQQVVFSTSHGGTWTPPAPIHDDGTADFSPQLAVLPTGQVLCAWQNVNRSLPDDVDLGGMAAALDIAVASYDSATGRWSTTALTNNSHLDYMPQIAAATNNTALVTWLSNEKDDILGLDANTPNTIRYCFWNGSAWGEPGVAGTGIGSMLRSVLAYDGTKAVYVYATDTDRDMGTDEDRELYALVYDGSQWSKPLRLTNDNVPDVNPQVVFNRGEPLLVWYRDGSIVSCRGLDTSVPQEIVRITGMGTRNFRLAQGPTGRISLVWTDFSTASKGTDVFTATYDPLLGVWSDPYALTSDKDQENALAVTYVDSDELALTYDKDRIRTDVEGDQEVYQTDLCVLRHGFARDLAVAPEDISVSQPNPRPGDTVDITAIVHNLGDVAEANVPVAFYHGNPDEDGVQIGDFQIIPGPIPAGGTGKASVSWTIPEANSPQQIYVTAFVTEDSQKNVVERNWDNNIAFISVMAPDLTVESVPWEKTGYKVRRITSRIANAGVAPAQNVNVTIHMDSSEGPELKHFTIPIIDANSVQEVSWDWDITGVDFKDPEIVLYVVVDEDQRITELNEDNNTGMCLVHVSKRGDAGGGVRAPDVRSGPREQERRYH
jgi:hypothetical protein